MVLLSMAQASERLGGSPSVATMYRLARDGHLPVKRIGRRLVISEHRLDEWANETGDAWSRYYDGTEHGEAS
jgi:excisionase family DNA binding protein